jgi:hypothetical protein
MNARASTLPVRLILSLLMTASPVAVQADDPVSSAVRFNREIIRIIQRKCEPCHAPGGLAMSLSTYREARAWGRAIREELVEQRMPPVSAAPGYGEFQAVPSLTAREMMTVLTWLDGGMPRGDDSDLPPRATAPTNGVQPDLRIEMPPQTVPPHEELIVRRVRVDAGRAAGRRVARIDVRPGDRRVVRGAILYATKPSASGESRDEPLWLDAWLPWQPVMVPPPGYAFAIPPGAQFLVELSYRGGEEPVVDRSAIDITFANAEPRGTIENLSIVATPAPTRSAASAHALRGQRVLAADTSISALQADVDPSIDSLEVRAQRPDGTIEVLLWMPTVDHHWPHAFVLQEPLTLPAGSTVTLHATTTEGAAQARVNLQSQIPIAKSQNRKSQSQIATRKSPIQFAFTVKLTVDTTPERLICVQSR